MPPPPLLLLLTAALLCMRGADAAPLKVAPCDANSAGQRWEVKWDPPHQQATVGLVGSDKPQCWEINGCDMDPHAVIDSDFGCKGLPKAGTDPGKHCDFNMAWSLNSNGTITAAMDGRCVTYDATTGAVDMMPCAGTAEQRWDMADLPADSPFSGQLIGPVGRGCLCVAQPGVKSQHGGGAANSAAGLSADGGACPSPRPRSLPSGGGGGGGGGCDGGCAFLIVLLGGGFVYFAAGFAYNHRARELRGAEAVPHVHFWRDLPHLMRDGAGYAARRIRGDGYTSV